MAGKRRLGLGALLGVIATAGTLAVAGLVVVHAGAYNVAATDDHLPLVRWALDTTMHRSVARRAQDVAPPEALGSDAMAAGAGLYVENCAHCHAGPGIERAHWARGMRPMPPELIHAATHWTSGELFWIVEHGVRMSGMPAFGPHHDDGELWTLVAFVERLPAMTPDEYRALTGDRAGGGHGHAGSGG